MNLSPRERLIVPLDLPTVMDAVAMVTTLGDSVSFYKVGYQLAFANGLGFIRELQDKGKQVFLDMKLLDIDNTVAKGVENIARLGVAMTTIHAYPKAMHSAVEAARGSPLTLLGVTVLTSMDDEDVAQAGYAIAARDLVLKRAEVAKNAGMGGVVVSAQEAAAVRELVGPEMAIVTPGIRPSGSASGDQKRVMTPSDAIKAGASHLVVGRPITAAADPVAAAEDILAEIDSAL